MAVFRVILNGKDTDQTIIATSKMDAYADVSVSRALKLRDTVQLKEIADPDLPEVGLNLVDLAPDHDDPLSQ
ncbi:hypothetical protein AXX12_04910 [Anaerosporomusa subterranea]|jgi:hypothetical protein|uniref:Uncharacterized protein n=1 Tax=Anaerosporomusa subterranea TaxID=1794912 RepID=A0A154BTV6_ANASB|nr:hypothetical protein [Anaerosporomusa subterranea]KYZ77454.1 hypothetical protein AXX12_04910 [Anaerosporomusa subterranea]MDF2501112.1 hypothetical protein [Anaerosporomusa subterranea]